MDLRTPIIVDVGTGSTKLGFGGNLRPSYILPTAVATRHREGGASTACSAHDEFIVGPSRDERTALYDVSLPVRRGTVANWPEYEKLMFGCLCDRLQVDTREHPVMLTEPPLAPPRHRECLAELMFETFQVPALHIGTQAVLALYGVHAIGQIEADGRLKNTSIDSIGEAISFRVGDLTGTVIDSGEGSTDVVPIVSGYVVSSAIRTVPLAGADATAYIQAALRERGEPLPSDHSLDHCRDIKHQYTYAVKDINDEASKLKARPDDIVKQHVITDARTRQATTISVHHERFTTPEIFFQPSLAKLSVPALPQLIDEAVQACSIDSRRKLYGSICLSGGSTLFKNFGRKLKMDLQGIVNKRLAAESKGVAVNVFRHQYQDIAVWVGGSLLSQGPEFLSECYTRADYEESGPSVCWDHI